MKTSQPRKRILPFFIPMEGCSYHCIYCDQQAVSGKDAPPDLAWIRNESLNFSGGIGAEVAFYGGTFTALPHDQQIAYLDAVAPAIAEGRIGGVRVSTRPDAIDEDWLTVLASKGVCTVELGIQSFDNEVLKYSGRGYGKAIAEEACQKIKSAGLGLGIQLMTGLPHDSSEKCLFSAVKALKLQADMIRIYPTVVLKNTGLAEIYAKGMYQPWNFAYTADTCAKMLALFELEQIPVIRIGLNPSASIEKNLLAGPYHPALGQIVKSRLKYYQLKSLIGYYTTADEFTVGYPADDFPLLGGQANRQLSQLKAQYPNLTFACRDIPRGNLLLNVNGQDIMIYRENFLKSFCAIIKQELREHGYEVD